MIREQPDTTRPAVLRRALDDTGSTAEIEVGIPSLRGTFKLKTGTPKLYVKTVEGGNKAPTPSALNAAHQSIQ
jgi:hypothetical protein